MLRNLFKDSVVYGITTLISKSVLFLVLPIYSRNLTMAEYGFWDLILTTGTLVTLIVPLEISQGLARYWSETPNKEKPSLASTAWWFSTIMFSLFLFTSLTISIFLSLGLFEDSLYIRPMRLSLLFIAINGLLYTSLNQLRWDLRSKGYFAVVSVHSILVIVTSLMFVSFFPSKLQGIIVSQLLSALLAMLLSIFMLRDLIKFDLNINKLRMMLRFALPLVPAGLATFVGIYANRFALNSFGTLEDIGVLAVAYKIAGLTAVAISGLRISLTPLIYNHYKEPRTPNIIARLLSLFIACSLLGSLLLTLYKNELIILFSTQEYLTSAQLIPFFALSILMSQAYIFFPGIPISEKTNLQLLVFIVHALVSFLANLILVFLFGVIGTGVAALLSSSVFIVLWIHLSQKLYYIKLKLTPIIISIIGFVACIMLSFVLHGNGNNIVDPNLVNLIIVITFISIVFLSKLLFIGDITKMYHNLIRVRNDRSS